MEWLKGKEAREEYHALLEEELASLGVEPNPLRIPPLRGLADELERHQRCASPHQNAERQFRRRVAPEDSPRPPHERHEEERRQPPGPEDVD